MTTTMTATTAGTTCLVCGEEFATEWEAEQDNHPCLPEHLRVTQADYSTASDALATAWSTIRSLQIETRPNRYAGECHVCLQSVAADSGFIFRNQSTQRWMVRHANETECRRALRPTPSNHTASTHSNHTHFTSNSTSTSTVRPRLEAGTFHVLDGRYYRVRPVRSRPGATRTQVARIVSMGPDAPARVSWVSAAHRDRQRLAPGVTTMTDAQAAEFGMLTSTCVRCSLALSDARSVAAGYGETCARTMGWRYPTMEEAAALIASRGLGTVATEAGGGGSRG